MAEAVSIVSVLSLVVQLQQGIHRIYDSLITSREGLKQARLTLEASEQKLQIWQKTWLDHSVEPSLVSQALWGTRGLADIQRILRSIATAVQSLEATSSKGVKVSSKSMWTRTISQMKWRKKKLIYPSGDSPKSSTLLELVLQLSRSIDELWTFSEVAFDSLHGRLAKSPQPARDKLLAESLNARAGSLALYRACNGAGVDWSLEVDLFGAGSEPQSLLDRPGAVSSRTSTRLFYHLFIQHPDTLAELTDVTVESFARPGSQESRNKEVVDYESFNLQIFDPRSTSQSGVICISTQSTGTLNYFRIAKSPTTVSLDSQSVSLTQVLGNLQKRSTLKTVGRLSLSARLELAYKLVECGFYLLGTPWLASLSSKRLRKMETSDHRPYYILEIQTLDLDDLFFEDPEALSEHSQLFRIGLLLVEIALSNPDYSFPVTGSDSGSSTSQLLPLVEQSMGSQYCKATAFCLENGRSRSDFGRPDKYQDPEDTGWNAHLRDVLQDYYSQVFLR